MGRLTVEPAAKADGQMGEFVEAFARRVEAMPPGQCPVGMMLGQLQASMAQTCGKCTPCAQGMPKIAALLRDVAEFRATETTVGEIRAKAALLRDTADCAVGWQAGQMVLEGLDAFADEFASHVEAGTCAPGTRQTVPCVTLCPAHVNVPAYIALAEEGRFAEAVKMIRKDNPFPTACALVCEHPCEERCRRTMVDAPVNIRGIKKYIVDTVAADTVETPVPLPSTGKRVAVVGAGPSGLTCAYFLALMGHEVVVYEARKKLGGMMRYGIPAYRFPRERLDEDIRAILGAGSIEVKTECAVDAAEMAKLAGWYDAVYVAIGAQGGKTLALEGADAEGVMSAVDLLGVIGDGEHPDFTGKKVVVIGGGNVAMDCARTSVRLGAESVTVAYRRRLEDMTALPAEVESAIAEGVEMMCLQAPERIEVDAEGRAAALVCQPQRIGAVKRGRPAPVAARGRHRAYRRGPGHRERSVRGVRHGGRPHLFRGRPVPARHGPGGRFRRRRLPVGSQDCHHGHCRRQDGRGQHRPRAGLRRRRAAGASQRSDGLRSRAGGRAPGVRAQARFRGRGSSDDRRGGGSGVLPLPAMRCVRHRRADRKGA